MHSSGACREALGWNGRPVQSDESRVRVQARQLYCFALAHSLGWQTDRSLDIVEGLFEVLHSICRRSDGLFGRRIDLSNALLIDDTADLYDNAFALLAITTSRQVLGAERVDPAIDELLAALDTGLGRGVDEGFAEFLPAPDYRLQNPHMHLFESTLAVYSVTGDERIKTRLDALLRFIRKTFFNTADSCVNEVAGSDDPAHRGTFEPGHSMEWVWLLGWHSRLLGEPYPEFGRKLYARALQTLDDRGRALMQVATNGDVTDPSRRLWSQTETLKAHLCMIEQTDGAESAAAEERAAACGLAMLEDWLQPAIAGGWHDHFDAGGKLISKDMPASSGYHLYCAIAELGRVSASRSA